MKLCCVSGAAVAHYLHSPQSSLVFTPLHPAFPGCCPGRLEVQDAGRWAHITPWERNGLGRDLRVAAGQACRECTVRRWRCARGA